MKVFARDVVKMAGYKFKKHDFESVLFFSCPWDQFRVLLILLILRVYPWLPCAKNPQSKILCKSWSISLMQTKHEHRTAMHCDLKFNHTSISSGIQILSRYLSVFWKLRCFEAKKRKRYALWIGALFCLFPKKNGSFRSR